MPLSSIDLWQRITAEGLADTPTCRQWAAEAARFMPTTDVLDGTKVLQQLVALEIVTGYQAQVLSGVTDLQLRRGPWCIRKPVVKPPFTGWFEVGPAEEIPSAMTGKLYWGKWLGLQELHTIKKSAPTLARCQRLAETSDPYLLPTFRPERFRDMDTGITLEPGNKPTTTNQLFLRCEQRKICLLTDCFSTSQPSASVAWMIVLHVSQALSALHRQGLVHGRVFPDRISWDGTQAMLITDPLCQHTATLDAAAAGILAGDLGEMYSLQFLAPEFLAPGQSPTPATDVFALGCTWWWLLTGLPKVSGKDPKTVLQAHTQGVEQLTKTIDLPLALQRILAHCLAPNPNARFPTAIELNEALLAAANTLGGKKPQSVPIETRDSEAASESLRNQDEQRNTETRTPPANPNPAGKSKPDLAAQHRSASRGNQSSLDAAASKNFGKRAVNKFSRSTAAQQKAKQSARQAAPKSPPSPKDESQAHRGLPSSPGHDASQRGALSTDKHNSGAQTKSKPRPTEKDPLTRGPVANSSTRRSRRKASKKWMIPVVGGCGFLILLLLALKFSGALERSQATATAVSKPPYVPPPSTPIQQEAADPRLEYYELTDSGGTELWAPPFAPAPIDLSLLPPGAGIFLSLQLGDLYESKLPQQFAEFANTGFVTRIQQFLQNSSLEPEQIRRMTIAFYAPVVEGQFPQTVVKLELTAPMPTAALLDGWNATTDSVDARLLISGENSLFLRIESASAIQESESSGQSDSTASFSIGPSDLMAEVQVLNGAPPPMLPAVEKLWQWTSQDSHFLLLTSPSFLFADGRGLWQSLPPKFEAAAAEWLERDIRATLVQSNFSPDWYLEWQMLANSGQITGKVATTLLTTIQELPNQMENWFVSQPPSPVWRGLAFRYPQMLRLAAEYTRVGIEDEIAIANAYLPAEAAPNLLLASWLALQPGATLANSDQLTRPSGYSTDAASPPRLTTEEYLARPIRLSFDQEPIEEALRLIGLEANDGLPEGATLRFELDGDAFELAGITRNQQLRDLSILNQPVREALTEVAKRGNPVTTVRDTREEDQRLVWVIKPDPSTPGRNMVSLTTREAVQKTNLRLPSEFSADADR